jgi:hypothetical protein
MRLFPQTYLLTEQCSGTGRQSHNLVRVEAGCRFLRPRTTFGWAVTREGERYGE